VVSFVVAQLRRVECLPVPQHTGEAYRNHCAKQDKTAINCLPTLKVWGYTKQNVKFFGLIAIKFQLNFADTQMEL